MRIQTGLRAGQSGAIDPEQVAKLVKELDCQISPFEMLGIAQQYCKNFSLSKMGDIMNMVNSVQ